MRRASQYHITAFTFLATREQPGSRPTGLNIFPVLRNGVSRYPWRVPRRPQCGSRTSSPVFWLSRPLSAFAPLARAADKQPPDDVEFSKDVVYGKGGGQDLKLDLSRPKQANGKRPCIVVFHGGGWAAGNKDQHDDVTWTLAQRGYVSATVGYRFAPAHVFPAQVEDAEMRRAVPPGSRRQVRH